MQSPLQPSFLKFTTPKHFLVRTVLSLTQRSTCILHTSKKQPPPKCQTTLHSWDLMKHDTTLYRYTEYAQVVLIIGITERISHFFCCLTIFATRSCMGWGSRVVLVSGTFSSTGNQGPTAQKKMVAQIEKSHMLYFCGSEDGFQEEKPGIFFVAHVEMPLLFFSDIS